MAPRTKGPSGKQPAPDTTLHQQNLTYFYVGLFSRTFWLNIPDAGKQPKLGCFSAFSAFGANVCIMLRMTLLTLRRWNRTLPMLRPLCGCAGNVVSKMQKKY